MHELTVIDPVSRIEGHAKITIKLDKKGNVADTRFHVTEFRGFEQFCVGRPVWEMPSLTARTCGICPVSHLLASAKACDGIMGVLIPDTAARLRRVVNLGQFIQSHALSFFHLSSPDLLLGWEADPAVRNVFGLMEAEPELARRGIRLRAFGQGVIEAIAGRKVHSPGIVPGGIANPMDEETRAQLLSGLNEAFETAEMALELFTSIVDKFDREVRAFGKFPSYYLGIANGTGTWEYYDGHLKVIDNDGNVVVDDVAFADYGTIIGESANSDSYLKSPFFKPAVKSDDDITAGMYRVGPLARVNLAERMGSPAADAALEAFRDRAGGIADSSFFFHYARLIEILACAEQIQMFLEDDAILDTHVRAIAGVNRTRSVGVSEAPRGTLFHEYYSDEHGLLEKMNMIIATGQNNLAMNATVHSIAQEYIQGSDIPEPILNRIEAGIRAFDPCLSCSTHAIGKMPLVITLEDASGEKLNERIRG